MGQMDTFFKKQGKHFRESTVSLMGRVGRRQRGRYREKAEEERGKKRSMTHRYKGRKRGRLDWETGKKTKKKKKKGRMMPQ